MEPWCTVGGNVNGTDTMGKVSSKNQKLDYCIIQQFHFWVYPQSIENIISKWHLYTHVHISISHSSKKWAQPKCLLTDEWFKHMMKYYSASKKGEILEYTTRWMNLEHIMLNEISLSQKEKYCIISFI